MEWRYGSRLRRSRGGKRSRKGLRPENQPHRSIANQLNAEGFKTKPWNAFSSVAVKTIITNPVYIGKIRYNVRENWNEKRRKGNSACSLVPCKSNIQNQKSNLGEIQIYFFQTS
ncbi:recombinase family protein [Bacillus sp. FJAT-27264]|uniref:recombinase family protein n=1 Tax=Paenibacillus sp. (strain DSM 101736 / FJAT-27264) TaxID=1850362 RepID=UPI0009F2164F